MSPIWGYMEDPFKIKFHLTGGSHGSLPFKLHNAVQCLVSLIDQPIPLGTASHVFDLNISQITDQTHKTLLIINVARQLLQQADHSLREGLLHYALTKYEFVLLSVEPSSMLKAASALPQDSVHRLYILNFIRSDMVDYMTNSHIIDFFLVTSKEENECHGIHEALQLVLGEELGRAKKKIANIWLHVAAQIKKNQALVGLVPCRWLSVPDPGPM